MYNLKKNLLKILRITNAIFDKNIMYIYICTHTYTFIYIKQDIYEGKDFGVKYSRICLGILLSFLQKIMLKDLLCWYFNYNTQDSSGVLTEIYRLFTFGN